MVVAAIVIGRAHIANTAKRADEPSEHDALPALARAGS